MKAIRHIPSLDGLRAVSFLLVFVAHCGFDRYIPGGFGVTVFFFLSGFLITTLMRAEFEKNHTVNFGHFWLRRGLRILPAFYLVLLVTLLASSVFDPPGTLSAAAVWAQLLHVTNYWNIYREGVGQPPGTGVYWSLAVEEHFYVFFPWLYVGMQRVRLSNLQQALFFWFLCALVLLWRAYLVYHAHATLNRTYMGSDTRVDSILFGCAMAAWKNPVIDELRLRERFWKFAVVPGAVLLIGLCLAIRTNEFRETIRYSLEGLALSAIFIAAIEFHHWLPFRILNWRPLAFIGLLSYSLYLIHFAVIFAILRILPNADVYTRMLLSFAASLSISWCIYVLIEKPCGRLRRRLTD